MKIHEQKWHKMCIKEERKVWLWLDGRWNEIEWKLKGGRIKKMDETCPSLYEFTFLFSPRFKKLGFLLFTLYSFLRLLLYFVLFPSWIVKIQKSISSFLVLMIKTWSKYSVWRTGHRKGNAYIRPLICSQLTFYPWNNWNNNDILGEE